MTDITEADAVALFRSEPAEMIDVGEGHAAYRVVGKGPDVLFVHGWPVSGATFRRLLPHLAGSVTCHLIDFPGSGSSRFGPQTSITVDQHIETVRRVVDWLGVESLAVVGHDSGGMIARHAVVGDARLRAMGLINTEPSGKPSWRFRSFIESRRVPGFGKALQWLAGQPRLRRSRFVLGDAFADASLLDGEFDEFFLRPLHESSERIDAAMRLLNAFDFRHIDELAEIHGGIGVPVKLVWGREDPFFPVARAEAMLATFPNASIEVIDGAGLFSHEERPAEVAAALLPILTS